MQQGALNVGMIGCGTISKAHLEAIESCDDLRLVGVADNNMGVASDLANRLPCTFYENNINLISDHRIDMVVLLTPPGHHEELITACALQGKHILVEKPVGVDSAKIKKYVELCKQCGVVLSIVSQHRFDDSALFLKQKVEQGMFGKLTGANCIVNWYRDQSYYRSWRREKRMAGGGVLTIQAIHTIDLMLWCMGEVEAVQAYLSRTLDTGIDIEDTAMACLKFKSGALGIISATTGAYPGYPTKLDIFGRDGSSTIEGDELTFYQSRKDQDQVIESAPKGKTILDPGQISVTALRAQYDDVIRAIRTHSTPIVSGEVAAITFSVIEAIYESAGQGKEIFLL